MKLSSTLTLEMLGKPFLLEKRIKLLYAIREHGSISKAAKAVPMSYKSAWEAVDIMNNLSDTAIVKRETGGKNGGGTTITSYGLNLLDTYKLLKEEHTRFLERLSVLPTLKNGNLKTIGRLAMQVSARNQIQGKILFISKGEVNVELEIEFKSGHVLKSSITKEAAENLSLELGQNIICIFKSSSVELLKSVQDNSKKNIIRGKVSRIKVSRYFAEDNRAEIIVDIGLGDIVVAIVDEEDIETIGVKEGSPIAVSIKANDVMVGR